MDLNSLPWLLDEDQQAIVEDRFESYASETGMTLDHTENDLEQAREQWVLEANARLNGIVI